MTREKLIAAIGARRPQMRMLDTMSEPMLTELGERLGVVDRAACPGGVCRCTMSDRVVPDVATFADTRRISLVQSIKSLAPGIAQATLDALNTDALADLATNLQAYVSSMNDDHDFAARRFAEDAGDGLDQFGGRAKFLQNFRDIRRMGGDERAASILPERYRVAGGAAAC